MNTQQTDSTITRAIGIMRAAMGITQPAAIVAPIIQAAAPVVKNQTKAVATIKKPVKKIIQHDVWHYLLGKDKVKS